MTIPLKQHLLNEIERVAELRGRWRGIGKNPHIDVSFVDSRLTEALEVAKDALLSDLEYDMREALKDLQQSKSDSVKYEAVND